MSSDSRLIISLRRKDDIDLIYFKYIIKTVYIPNENGRVVYRHKHNF